MDTAILFTTNTGIFRPAHETPTPRREKRPGGAMKRPHPPPCRDIGGYVPTGPGEHCSFGGFHQWGYPRNYIYNGFLKWF